MMPLLLLLLWSGCGKAGPTKQERIDAFNETGWEQFQKDEFAVALRQFNSGLDLDGDDVDGNLGRGWSLLMLGDPDLDTTTAALEKATASAAARQDAWCGMSAVALNDQRYPAADSLATLVLTANPAYVFVYRDSVNWRDLLLIQAQARYFTTDYAGAWDATLTLTVGTEFELIDPADPSTWVIGARLFTLFEELLAKVISRLAEQHRGT